MNVIFLRVDLNGRTFQPLEHRGKISFKFILQFILNPSLTILGAENQVDRIANEGLGHRPAYIRLDRVRSPLQGFRETRTLNPGLRSYSLRSYAPPPWAILNRPFGALVDRGPSVRKTVSKFRDRFNWEHLTSYVDLFSSQLISAPALACGGRWRPGGRPACRCGPSRTTSLAACRNPSCRRRRR